VTVRPKDPGFPELSACPAGAEELVHRWEVLLARSPRLRPWLAQMLGRHRALLQETLGGAEVERALWGELARWLRDFEKLPQFAVSAIATTLQEEERAAVGAGPERDFAGAAADSPERAVAELQALLADPAFALAFHCVDARLRPPLAASLAAAPSLSRIPEAAWFGLLHASGPPQPLLTPDVAVALVLRVLSPEWARLPAAMRKAALRLFHAGAGDLRAADAHLRRLCEPLPPAWQLGPAGLPEFVAAAGRTRAALAEACDLCARFVAAAAAQGLRRGGLAVLQESGAQAAGAGEVAELAQTARKYKEMAGFQKLLALL
jgi:hypothetical protein